MRIEYIGHSGVLVELNNINLLFDVIGFSGVISDPNRSLKHDVGLLPSLDPTKDTVVLVSHNHGDHYSENIWKLREQLPNIQYILSKDVHFSSGVRTRLGISDEYAASVVRVKNYTNQDISLPSGSHIHVQTIPATDEGVAYLVEAEGHTIYHAGDHHMWLWEEAGQSYMNNMSEVFKRTLSRLELKDNQIIDVAFLLLDSRLSEQEVDHAYDGIDTYLSTLPIKHVVPIHQWKNYDITDRYVKACNSKLENGVANIRRLATSDVSISTTVIHKVTGENCSFEID